MAISTLCMSVIPRKIVPSSCVLPFDEGMLSISVLHEEEDSWGTPRILEAPEYWTQGQQIHRWIREPGKAVHSTGTIAGVHIKVAGAWSDQSVFQITISFRGQGTSPACCSHMSCSEYLE